MISNHYKTLEIEPTATKEEILKAYRRLALKFYFDKNKRPDAYEKCIAIKASCFAGGLIDMYLFHNNDRIHTSLFLIAY